jgi:hypothetical protein
MIFCLLFIFYKKRQSYASKKKIEKTITGRDAHDATIQERGQHMRWYIPTTEHLGSPNRRKTEEEKETRRKKRSRQNTFYWFEGNLI